MKNSNLILLLVLGVALFFAFGGGGVVPSPFPAPIPDTGLRVLVTYSEANRDNLPAGQKAILQSLVLRTWLDAHCVKNAAGVPEWRIWPDTANPRNEGEVWQRLMALPRGQPEWLTVSDGKRGTSQALPLDETALMAVLSPYGGGL